MEEKLTGEAVDKIFMDCLYKQSELPGDGTHPKDAVLAEGIVARFGFHPKRLESHRQEIIEMVKELPDVFFEDADGGGSFLDLPIDRGGRHWGEHINCEQLLCLSLALGLAKYCAPRSQWLRMPGRLPYVVFNLSRGAHESTT